ncbi:MAG: diguanylate cyclase [Pseudomonadota bacterium]|nr:diguanylate cyclase [Pseudomonadota bacterium]
MKHPTSAMLPVIAGFSVMLLLLLAVTAIGVTHIRHLSDQLTAIVSERNQKSEYAATMLGLHEARFQSLLLASSLDDAFSRDEEAMRFSRMAREFIQVRDRFLALPLDAPERALWEAMRGEVRQVETHANEVLELLQSDQLPQARAYIKKELTPHQVRMMQGWARLLELQREKNQQALARAHAARDRAQKLAISLSAAALIIGAIIAVFVVRLSRRLEKDLFEEKERAQITLQAIGDAVVRIDEQLATCYLNPVAEHLLGLTSREAMGRPICEVLHLFKQEDRQEISTQISQEALRGAPCALPLGAGLTSAQGMEFEVEGVCSPIHSPDGEIMGAVLVLRDVTEARAMQRKLRWQTNHDTLTGLINRHEFEERVARALGSKRAAEFPASILLINLDRFKFVNDTAGHAAGDELLRQLGRLIQTRMREADLLARLGGDEFGVMLVACPPHAAEMIAHLLQESLAGFSFVWNGQHYQAGASIGVVHIPPHGASLDECMAAADAACHQAKHNGGNEVVIHRQ